MKELRTVWRRGRGKRQGAKGEEGDEGKTGRQDEEKC